MDLVKGISQVMQQAAARNSSEEFGQVAVDLVKIKDKVREEIQALTTPAIKAIINKLEHNQGLTPEEKETVKLWVVGDAEGFVELEDTLKDWQQEYRDLTAALQEFEGKPVDLDDLVALHGLLEDAIQVADDLAHFLDDQERLVRFQKAIDNLDAEGSKFVADLLKSELASPNY